MDTRLSDMVLAFGMSLFIVGALMAVEELVGFKALAAIGMVAIIGWLYRWIRSWDYD